MLFKIFERCKRAGKAASFFFVAVLWVNADAQTLERQSLLGNVGSLEIAGVEFHAQNLRVDAELVNNGRVAVVAYAITVVARYANGDTRQNHVVRDISQALAVQRSFPQKSGYMLLTPPETLPPGEYLHYQAALPAGESSGEIVAVQAYLTAVWFDDGTAAGNDEEVGMLRERWREELDESHRWLPLLNRLRGSRALGRDSRRLSARLSASDARHDGQPGLGLLVRDNLKRHLDHIAGAVATAPTSAQLAASKLIELTEKRVVFLSSQLSGKEKGGRP